MTRGTRRLLIEVLAVLALINAATALQLAQSIPDQQALGVSYPPGVRLILAVLWTALFVGLIIRLLRRPRATIRLVPPLLTLYGLSSIIWLLLFARTDFDRGRIPFQIVATGLLLVLLWWLCRDRPAAVNIMESPPPSPNQPPERSIRP